MAAKSLDIPYDEMRDITVTNNGLPSWVLAAAMLVGGIGGGIGLMSRFGNKAENSVADPVETRVIDRDVRIDVDVISPD